MIKKIFSVVLTVIILFFFKKIELFFISNQFSWTFSKISPYSLLILSGIFLSYSFINLKSKIFNLFLKIILFSIPFCFGFLLFPIYEGDFSLNGNSNIINSSPNDFKNDGLMVVAIADCPFCLGSIEKLKLIKDRNPNLQIDFVVCTKNKKYIENYISASEGKFRVNIAQNPDSLALTVGGRFPSFIKVVNKEPAYLWSNDQFGVRAIDELERNYNSK